MSTVLICILFTSFHHSVLKLLKLLIIYCRNYVYDRFIVNFVYHIKDRIYLITCREGIEGE
jgi:hypothetical protein